MAESSQPANPFLGDQAPAEPASRAGKTMPQSSPSPEKPESPSLSQSEPVVPRAVESQPERQSAALPGNETQKSSARLATEEMLAPAGRRFAWRGLLRWGTGTIAVILVALALYWWWQRPAEPIAIAEPVAPSAPAPRPTVTEAPPQVLADDSASFRSENFKAGEIVFLGEAEFLQTDEGIAPLTLDGIRGEAFTEKNKQEVKLVITWNTNKLARGEVSYAKGIGQTPTVIETDDFAYDHSLILSGLDPATTYLYTIKALDRFGNVASSEPYAVFTGARSVSLFDLIAGAIGEVFGWAVK